MNTIARMLIFLAPLAIAGACASGVVAQEDSGPRAILYDGQRYSGAPQPVTTDVERLGAMRFDDRASSINIREGVWEICEGPRFEGRCEVLSTSVDDLAEIGLNNAISSIRPYSDSAAFRQASAAAAPLTLYSKKRFGGTQLSVSGDLSDLRAERFNNKARSVEINEGVWALCTRRGFAARCDFLDRSMDDLDEIGLSGEISSIYRTPLESGPDGFSVALFDRRDFRGRFTGVESAAENLGAIGFANSVRSILVNRGQWLICAEAKYRGRCEVVSQSYADLRALKFNDAIVSIQPYDGERLDDGRRGGGRGPTYGGEKTLGQVSAFFPAPEADGLPIDSCLGDAAQCEGAAFAFCREAGYAEAVFSAIRENVRETADLDGELACSGFECRALTDVLCASPQ